MRYFEAYKEVKTNVYQGLPPIPWEEIDNTCDNMDCTEREAKMYLTGWVDGVARHGILELAVPEKSSVIIDRD